MKNLILVSMVWAMAGLAFSQKNESFSFDCASNNYSFTGIRIGETIKPGVNGNEYYYENADGKTAFIYRIQYYNNKIFIVHKVIIPISGKLDKLTLATDNFTFNINSSYGGPENSEEKCNCDDGKISTRKGNFFPVYGFGFTNDAQKAEFQKLLDKLNETITALK